MRASGWIGVGLLFLGPWGCREPTSTPAPTPGTSLSPLLTVEGTTVHYNGQPLSWEETDRWRQVLGPPSRQKDGILTWDDLGIFLYDQDPQVPGPESFEVLLGRVMHSPLTERTPDFWPHRLFSGRLLVEGALITRGSPVEVINRDKKGASFERGYMSGVYSYHVSDFSVRLDYGHDRSLTSFGLDKQLPSPVE